MKFVFFIVLAVFGVVATVSGSAIDTSSTDLTSLLKSLKSTNNQNTNGATISAFFTHCPDANLHFALCFSAANPGNDECAVIRAMINCMEGAIAAYESTCVGADQGRAEVELLRAELVERGCGTASGTASVVAGFLPVVVMTIFNFLRWI